MHTFTAKTLFTFFTISFLMVLLKIMEKETPILIVIICVLLYGLFTAIVLLIDQMYDED